MPLLLVLWTVGLLAIIAAASQSSGTMSYTLARDAAETARLEARAEAALNLAALSLLEGASLQREGNPGLTQSIRYEGSKIQVDIQDELGRIDLNHADTQLLAGLFRAVGMPAQEAASIADRIQDWRDPDDLRRLNGAEAREYRASGASHAPRNAGFQVKDELQLVLGITRDIYQKAEPALTIHSGKPGVDRRIAPPLVQRALGGDTGDFTSTVPTGARAGRAFALCIKLPAGKDIVTWEAAIRFTGDSIKPYWLLDWDRKPCGPR